MKLSKKIYYNACSVIPTGVLKRIIPATTLLPYHHLVSDADVLHVKHLYPYKNTSQFTEDLDRLLKYFKPVSVDEIVETVVSGKKMPKNSFLLSFDDGFKEVYEVIAPILSSKGVPALFFVNPAFLDNRQLFYRCKISLVIEKLIQKRDSPGLLAGCMEILGNGHFQSPDGLIAAVKNITQLNQDLLNGLASKLELSFDDYLEKNQPFLTSSQVKELSDKGFSIGAHSWDHPYYHLISAEEQLRQTVNSSRYIKENFSPAFNFFSFPHSDQTLPQSFFDHLGAGEINGGITIDLFFGIQNQKWELANKVLHRFNAERPELPMKKQLNGVLLWMGLQRILQKHIVRRV